MQTSVKKVKLRGHDFESDVTVRHRTTLGKFEASVQAHPHLKGEGDTEPAALDDLSAMLSSDPTAHDEVKAKNKAAADVDAVAAAAAPAAAADDNDAWNAPITHEAGVTDTLAPADGATIEKE